jgi:hypothetical protein
MTVDDDVVGLGVALLLLLLLPVEVEEEELLLLLIPGRMDESFIRDEALLDDALLPM